MSDREKKNALTPKETEQAVSDLAERLAEMDKAEGIFGEAMAESLPDKYLDEVVGGLLAVVPTSAGPTEHYKVCTSCNSGFFTYDINQELCDRCLNSGERT